MPESLHRSLLAGIIATNAGIRAARQTLLFLLVVLVLSGFARPQRLPLKVYTASDGMASSVVGNIVRDSDGFLWFSARGGLTRYDGNAFVAVRFTDSESSPLVHGFLESRDGRYLWISTDNALYRVSRHAPSDVTPTDRVARPGERVLAATNVTNGGFWKLFETRDGRLITGSADGISEALDPDADTVEFRPITYSRTSPSARRTGVRAFVETADGSLWLAADIGIVRRLPDHRWITYEVPSVIAYGNEAFSILTDEAGRIWISYRSGVFVLKPEPPDKLSALEDLSVQKVRIRNVPVGVSGEIDMPDADGEMVKLDFADRKVLEPGQAVGLNVQEIFRSADGTIWMPTKGGLYYFRGESYGRLRDDKDLPGPATAIAEAPNGDLWFGTLVGAIKYVRHGLTSYSSDSGLLQPSTSWIGEYSGNLVVSHGLWHTSVLERERIETRQMNLPPEARSLWTSFAVVPDAVGGMWALTNHGLYHFPPKRSLAELTGQKPKLVKNALAEIADKAFYRAFNDSRGRIWFSAVDIKSQQRVLFRHDPTTGEWIDLSTTVGFPKDKTVASFAEDRAGNVWFGYYNGPGILKLSGGRFTEYGEESGFPGGSVLALLTDSKGRIWLGSNQGGVARIDDPTVAEVKITRYTENEGLSSNNVRCLAEDRIGRVYAGTVRGVTQIDAAADRLRIISTEDGLAADFVQSAYRDGQGTVWFGTSNGVSRLESSTEQAAAAPPVFITALQIAGMPYGISGLGQQSASGIEVGPSENNLQVTYTAVGNALRFQYRLDAGSESDWRTATAERSVDFANLAPGSYSFLVRAVTTEGAVSERPAVLSFRVYPPIWQRWWFIALGLLTFGAAVFSLDRYRVLKARQVNQALTGQLEAERALQNAREERFKELERVRARIATDLHDDIGSSLTQIAVLSEVARGAASKIQAEQLARPLDRIKTVSKELVTVMSDVVWAINPQKDHLVDLVQRMRRFGSDIFSGRGIAFEFIAPEAEDDLQLGANIRRELFAIFKESANNAVKHSDCTCVSCEFKINGEQLTLKIADDGVGFDPDKILSDDFKPEIGGNGLVSMRRRVAELGGIFSIGSNPGEGTTVTMNIPLHTKNTEPPN